MTGSQDWLNDLEDSNDDGGSKSLFEENFTKMVEDHDLDSLALQTLEDQVDRIDDADLLRQAKEQDGRDEAEAIYDERIDELAVPETQDESEEDPEEDEQSDEADDPVEVGDEDESESEDSEGDGPADGDAAEEPADSGAESEETGEVSEDPQERAQNAQACTECDDAVRVDGENEKPFDIVDGSVVCEECQDNVVEEAADDVVSDSESEEDPEPSTDGGDSSASNSTSSDLPDVDVTDLAPNAVSRDDAAAAEKQHTFLVWGPEGAGKSHIAHTAPEPIAYIDTEGKADELASKFDKEIQYWEVTNYKEAKQAMEEAFAYLNAYLEAGHRGTLVVDSMTAMWEYAKVDYAKFAYQTDDLSEVNFQSELENEKDWTKIKGRHNDGFREEILDQDFHVVFTSGQKEGYYTDEEYVPDGEKWNKYAVKDVVQLRRNGDGKTVADLRKAAKTRYSFVDLVWPDWTSIYQAIRGIHDAEQAPEPVDVDEWTFGVVDGQPTSSEPSDGDEEDGDE